MPLDAATCFKVCNLLALTGWVVLIINLLRRRPASRWPGAWVPVLLALVYLSTLIVLLPGSQVDFGSLAGVQALFSQPWWVLVGWSHYLAFDLLVGAWEVNQAQALQLPRAVVLVCLLLTFMFGPVGWLAFLSLRAWAGRSAGASAAQVM